MSVARSTEDTDLKLAVKSQAHCWCCPLDVKALSLSPLLVISVAGKFITEDQSAGAQEAL